MTNYKRVAVIRGGPSDEYPISIKTGSAVSDSLMRQGYLVKNIFVTKNKEWLYNGKPTAFSDAFQGIDVAFIAMHGKYGEDGELQQLLRRLNVPYTGSTPMSSAMAFNKLLTKESLLLNLKDKILTPKYYHIRKDEFFTAPDKVVKNITNFKTGYIIKPVSNGSSNGVKLFFNKDELISELNESLKYYDELLIEEYIKGRDVSCAVLDNYRENDYYVFPIAEMTKDPDELFLTYDAKYSDKNKIFCPANFSLSEREKIAEITKLVHETLGLRQYSKSDFVVNMEGQVYFLEVNTLPELTKKSLFPKAAEAIGMSYDELASFLVETAKV